MNPDKTNSQAGDWKFPSDVVDSVVTDREQYLKYLSDSFLELTPEKEEELRNYNTHFFVGAYKKYTNKDFPDSVGMTSGEGEKSESAVLENKPEIQLLLYRFIKAKHRLRQILPEGYTSPFTVVHVCFLDGGNDDRATFDGFSFSGSKLEVYYSDAKQLLLAVETDRFETMCTAAESQYIHEIIHGFDRSEALPQLAEFLYDPVHNTERNQKVFNYLSEILSRVIFGVVKEDDLEENESHLVAWREVAKLLLVEYQQFNHNFVIPEDVEEQLRLLMQLPTLYSSVPQEKRDIILKKYLTPENLGEDNALQRIRKIAQENGERLGLKF